jgi:FkbM family methyltransferase
VKALVFARQTLRNIVISLTSEIVPKLEVKMLTIGRGYGSWRIPASVISTPGRTAVLAGAGEEITLDKFLSDYGFEVFIVDPTPRAIKFAELEMSNRENVKIIKHGFWSKSGVVDFWLPIDPSHVSLSIKNLQKSSKKMKLAVKTVKDFMNENNISHIDILKLDIEGAAIDTLDKMFSDHIYPDYILVEYEDFALTLKFIMHFVKIRKSNYKLVSRSELDFVFVRSY